MFLRSAQTLRSATWLLLSLALLPLSHSAKADPPIPSGMHDITRMQQTIEAASHGNIDGCSNKNGAAVEAAGPFQVTLECKVSCIGDPKKVSRSQTTEFRFSPEERKLSYGDGGLPYESLSANLLEASRMSCLQAAAITCGGLSKIKKSKVTSLTSGTWSVPVFDACNEKSVSPASPYDEKFTLARKSGKSEKEMSNSLSFTLPSALGGYIGPRPRSIAEFIQEFESMLETPNPQWTKALQEVAAGKSTVDQCMTILGEDYGSVGCLTVEQIVKLEKRFQNPKTCNQTVRAESCYGDCMSEGGVTRKILGSPNPNARTQITLCADPLEEELKKPEYRGLSKNVLKQFCEDFVSRSILHTPPAHPATTGKTCAAFRFKIDCKPWVEKFLKKT